METSIFYRPLVWLEGLLVAALMLIWVPSQTTGAVLTQPQSAVADLKERMLAEEVDDVRVIVRLKLPDETETRFNRAAVTVDELESRRQTVSSAQDRLLSQLDSANLRLYTRYEVIPYVAIKTDQAGLELLANSPDVIHIQEDIELTTFLDSSVPVVGAETAWNRGFRGSGKAVVVFDTGVQASHPFFENRVVDEACFSNAGGEGDGTTLCPNGQPSQIGPGASDPLTTACVSETGNICFHGTHVAGIVAGENQQFSGVAPDAEIIGVQVFTRKDDISCIAISLSFSCVTGYLSDQILALEHVLTTLRFEHDIVAINMSLGGGEFSDQAACDGDAPGIADLVGQLRDVGIATIAASGNNGWTNSLALPGCLSDSIGIGATEDNDVIASYSNMHAMVDLMAPGSTVESAVPGGGYEVFSGTSMATPHVAGAWAILSQQFPDESIDQLLARLVQTGVMIEDTRSGGTVSRPRIDLAPLSGAKLTVSDVDPITITDIDQLLNIPLILQNVGIEGLNWTLAPEPETRSTVADPLQPSQNSDPINLSQSISTEIVDGNSSSCSAGGHSWLRAFDLTSLGGDQNINLNEIEFGIESASSLFGLGQSVIIRLYTLSGDVVSFENMTQIGEFTTAVSDSPLTLVRVPLGVEVSTNNKLVVELHHAADIFSLGLAFGSNRAGETGPSYYYAPSCDVSVPTAADTLGGNDQHIVMSLFGDYALPPAVCNEWIGLGLLSPSITSGSLDPNQSANMTLTLDSSTLTDGPYAAELCFETDVDDGIAARVPLRIDVNNCENPDGCAQPTPTPTAVGPTPTAPAPTPIPTIGPPPVLLQAEFEADQQAGNNLPFVVSFTDLSLGSVQSCLWDFGDGTQSTQCGNVQHAYLQAGTYTVSLTVTGLNDTTDTETKTDYISIVTDQTQQEFLIFLPLIMTE